MRIERIPFEQTTGFSSLFLDYIQGDEKIRSLYAYDPDKEGIKAALDRCSFSGENRSVLYTVVKEQNASAHSTVLQNVELLKDERSFTITTGHQLNLATGPLYFIYKIVTVLRICDELKRAYPDYHFLPLFWMASEDHDFDEINHFHLFNNRVEWNTDQKGAVGRFHTDDLAEVLKEVPDLPEFIREAYHGSVNLAEATRFLVDYLFGEKGLIIVDADDIRLKKLLIPVIEKELIENSTWDHVNQTSEILHENGYKPQVIAREINLFYLHQNGRNRIVGKEDSTYSVLETDIHWTRKELLNHLRESPEHFSPNVLLRPVYQQTILPNLGYVGGPAEIAYWLQLKSTFEFFETSFPVLFPRAFCVNLNGAIQKKIKSLGFEIQDVFLSEEELTNLFLQRISGDQLSLDRQRKEIEDIFEQIIHDRSELDQSIQHYIRGEKVKVQKTIDNIQQKIKKEEKQKQEVNLLKIRTIKEKLFPGGEPQERVDNFLNLFINNTSYIDGLYSMIQPFDFRYNVLLND